MTNKITFYCFLKIKMLKCYLNTNLNIVLLYYLKKSIDYKRVLKLNKKEDQKINVGLKM